jgi:hypothetical protein
VQRNTHRQPSTSVTAPPSSRPLIVPMLAIAASSDSARVRSGPDSNRLPISASAAGTAAAAPNPCTTRAPTSTPSVGASPATTAPAANTPSPQASTRRRP